MVEFKRVMVEMLTMMLEVKEVKEKVSGSGRIWPPPAWEVVGDGSGGGDHHSWWRREGKSKRECVIWRVRERKWRRKRMDRGREFGRRRGELVSLSRG